MNTAQPYKNLQASLSVLHTSYLLNKIVVAIICIPKCIPMSKTKSSLPHLGIFRTSLMAATFLLGTMCNTHSTLDNNVSTSTHKGTKSLLRCTTMSDTYSTLLGSIGTFLKAALPYHCFLCTMCDTYSSLLGMIVTSLVAASLDLGTMSNTPSSLNCLIGTSIGMVASFLHCAMCNTYSTPNGSIGTSVMTALFDLGSMCNTYSPLHDLIGTSLHAASLGLGTMRSTYSSNSGFFDTSLDAASGFTTCADNCSCLFHLYYT